MGTACCAGTPLSGAIVQLFRGNGEGRHVVATSIADAAGRFAVRTGAGTYTLEISYPGHEPHRQLVTLANAPVSAGSVRLRCSPLALDALTVCAERDAVQPRSGAARPPGAWDLHVALPDEEVASVRGYLAIEKVRFEECSMRAWRPAPRRCAARCPRSAKTRIAQFPILG